MNEIIIFTSFSNVLLLFFRNVTDFSMLILYPATSLPHFLRTLPGKTICIYAIPLKRSHTNKRGKFTCKNKLIFVGPGGKCKWKPTYLKYLKLINCTHTLLHKIQSILLPRNMYLKSQVQILYFQALWSFVPEHGIPKKTKVGLQIPACNLILVPTHPISFPHCEGPWEDTQRHTDLGKRLQAVWVWILGPSYPEHNLEGQSGESSF